MRIVSDASVAVIMLATPSRVAAVATVSYAAEAAALAKRLDHPIYDCRYAALAKRENAWLATADRRFAAKLAHETVDLVRALAKEGLRQASIRILKEILVSGYTELRWSVIERRSA